MFVRLASVLVAMCLVGVGSAHAAAIQISAAPGFALHDSDTQINGVCLNIWGRNPQKAAALGFVNGSTGDSGGFSWSLYNYAENYSGVQWAFFNRTSNDFTGWQHGVVNYVGGNCQGLQWGFVNVAYSLKGLQLGAINYATEIEEPGIQVGLVNIIRETDTWFRGVPKSVAPGMVFVNWRF